MAITEQEAECLPSQEAWLDQRTNLRQIRRAILQWPVPKYVEMNLLYTLGGLTLMALFFQMFTGLLLSFYYDPSPANAYNSVDYITYQVPLGWLIRGVHHYNASAIVILVVLHMVRTFASGAYRKPRELTWLFGVALLLITLGFAFTGYLLPWDQRGYWATTVGTGMAGNLPLIGETLAQLMRGGSMLGQLTLTRFYITHVALLPLLLMLFIVLHLYQHRYHGVAPSVTRRGEPSANKFVPFYPNGITLTAILGLGLLALLIYLSWAYRAPLEFPANPNSTDYIPRPEWYFLFFFQLLHYVPGVLEPLILVLLPITVIGSMVALPFIDRKEESRIWRKPILMGTALFYILSIVLLTWLAL